MHPATEILLVVLLAANLATAVRAFFINRRITKYNRLLAELRMLDLQFDIDHAEINPDVSDSAAQAWKQLQFMKYEINRRMMKL